MALKKYRRQVIRVRDANDELPEVILSTGDEAGRIIQLVITGGENYGTHCRFWLQKEEGLNVYQDMEQVTASYPTWEAAINTGGLEPGVYPCMFRIGDNDGSVTETFKTTARVLQGMLIDAEESEEMQSQLSEFEQRTEDAIAANETATAAANDAAEAATAATDAIEHALDEVDVRVLTSGVLSVTNVDGVPTSYDVKQQVSDAINPKIEDADAATQAANDAASAANSAATSATDAATAATSAASAATQATTAANNAASSATSAASEASAAATSANSAATAATSAAAAANTAAENVDQMLDVIDYAVEKLNVTCEIGSIVSGAPSENTKYLRAAQFNKINKGDVVHFAALSKLYRIGVYLYEDQTSSSLIYTIPTSIDVNAGSDGYDFVAPNNGYFKFRACYIPQSTITENDLVIFGQAITYVTSELQSRVINDAKNINKILSPNVHSIFHRGYNLAPENTLIAFKQAKLHNAEYVETDIRFTSDNVPVLLHDATINRTARNADGTVISSTINIADITYAQALEYDFGLYKSSDYAGEKIPNFNEFMLLCKNLGLKPFIELKTGTSEQIAQLYNTAKSYGFINDICWTGEGTYLNYIQSVDQNATICYITRNPTVSVIASFKNQTNIVIAGIEQTALTAEIMQDCIDNDLEILSWTIDIDDSIISTSRYVKWYITNGPVAEQVLYDYTMAN